MQIAQLAEEFDALDGWMSSGGFRPTEWTPKRGRPKETTDGVVLQGVKHGTPHAYNQGCHCIPCRAANTDRQADLRARKRENGAS